MKHLTNLIYYLSKRVFSHNLNHSNKYKTTLDYNHHLAIISIKMGSTGSSGQKQCPAGCMPVQQQYPQQQQCQPQYHQQMPMQQQCPPGCYPAHY